MFPSFPSRMMASVGLVLLLGVGNGWGRQQDSRAQEIVRVATQTEIDASREDHSHWEYKDFYKGESGAKVLLVVETGKGSLKKKVEADGRPLTPEELKKEDARSHP